MAILRSDIERALENLASEEEGMRFQGLAVVLGKRRWPQLIAHQRKKDLGLDAYAPPSETPERIGKGLAASITPKLIKVFDDAQTAKRNFPDLRTLLFVTAGKVGNANRKKWGERIQNALGLDLIVIEREEIITQMMMPENAELGTRFLHLGAHSEPQVGDLVGRTRRAAAAVTATWAGRTRGHPLVDLATVKLDPNGEESAEVLSLEQIDQVLSQSRRVVLEGPPGRGKTTMLIQLAQRERTAGTPFLVDLPAWTSSRRGILEYLAGMPAFLAEGLTAADLARVQQIEPFLLLLNGWNEIAESNSAQANDALRELDRDFPSAGVIVATRTHHLTPPLPGASRLRLLHVRPAQRAAYIDARLGASGTELRARIDTELPLDELTRTAFTLSEIVSLFEAGTEIPSTRVGVLTAILGLQEQRDEHRNALQVAPIFGRQADYLKALATEMTRRGAVALPERDARAIVASVARELLHNGQIEPVRSPTILATLTAHHVLEFIDYPETGFRFEHQLPQEYFAALDVRQRLFQLRHDDRDATSRFTANYVNDPAWSETLRMIAETLAERTGDDGVDTRNTLAGVSLVKMALTVDLVFAGELSRLCGSTVWGETRAVVGQRYRAVHANGDGTYRQYALGAMLAAGAEDFSDLIVPLLSAADRETRLSTYRLWPDIRLGSLGGREWREQVRRWSEEARADFVSELLHHRVDEDVTDFAVEDESIAVKKAAAEALMWNRSEDALTRVLESMDGQAFEAVAREQADLMPRALRFQTVAAMRRFIETSKDDCARLRTALDLVGFGETGLDHVIKNSMLALADGDMRNWGPHSIQPAVEYLRHSDAAWASEWVAVQICEGTLYDHEHWLPFATFIPGEVVQKYLRRLETEEFRNTRLAGMIAVITARGDARIAARVFAGVRERRRRLDAATGEQREVEWHMMRQLEAVFRGFSDEVAAAGVISSVAAGDALDIKVASGLLSRVARSDSELLRVADGDLRAHLRAYLKDSVGLVLRQDDFNGEEKADLASSLAQVGAAEDMADLVLLIRADIERVRRGRKARVAGDRGPLGNGGAMSYATWHVAAVIQLDAAGAEQVLVGLLHEPEYRTAAASAMARDYIGKPDRPLDATFRYDLMWDARERGAAPSGEDQRRTRFAEALLAEIERLRQQNGDAVSVADVGELGRALSAIDGRGSAEVVLDVIAMPGPWGQYTRLDTLKRLLTAGVVLPAGVVFALADSWTQESDTGLLCQILALCPFVDDPAAGIAKVREVFRKRRLLGYELRGLVTSLGESRSEAAIDLLYEIAADAQAFEQCEDSLVNAIAALDLPSARQLLLGFVDPDIHGIPFPARLGGDDAVIARLTELAQRWPAGCARLRELCERDLAERDRRVLSRVMDWLGTPETLSANLNLIDDSKPSPVPQGVWHQLEAAFVERRPYGGDPNGFSEHARASNELRMRLFRMAVQDPGRRRSACDLLGRIEEWRLEHGRPMGEPRHPDLTSGEMWPPEA